MASFHSPLLLTILGPTASGKTSLAAQLAFLLDGEVISADSRQVYRGMDIGTGKDMSDYTVEGKTIPLHLTDLADPGEEYNVFRFLQDFSTAFRFIARRGRLPILCGGSGLYLEAALKGYRLQPLKPDPGFRSFLEMKTDEELRKMLSELGHLHNTTDLTDRARTIRAIEIAHSEIYTGDEQLDFPKFTPLTFGIQWDRETLCQRISHRLDERIRSGMIEETETLLKKGVTPDQLKFYGLEYRYSVMYLQKELDFDGYFRHLNIAIRQFAKRQMTWFRRMERNGTAILWLNGNLPMEEKIRIVHERVKQVIS